jgi:hypothetical protein
MAEGQSAPAAAEAEPASEDAPAAEPPAEEDNPVLGSEPLDDLLGLVPELGEGAP